MSIWNVYKCLLENDTTSTHTAVQCKLTSEWYMWLDLQKSTTYTYNDKVEISLPINIFIIMLTKHNCATTTIKQVWFY